jgi:SH3-like domain-containing protein
VGLQIVRDWVVRVNVDDAHAVLLIDQAGWHTMLITGEVRTLRRSDSAEAPAVARLEPGVIGQFQQCRDDWCRLEAGGLKGWFRRSEFWGAYPDEAVK